jgi:hypothetical protein
MTDKENYPPRRYGPFDVLPVETQTEQQKQEISFLETAHREGYEATTCGTGDFGATANERGG